MSLYHASWAGCSVFAHPLAVLWSPAIPSTLSGLNLVCETWTWWRAHAIKAVLRLWSTNLARILRVLKPLMTSDSSKRSTRLDSNSGISQSQSTIESTIGESTMSLVNVTKRPLSKKGTSATFPSSGDSAGHQRSMDPRHSAMRRRSAKAMIRKMSSAAGSRRR
ncbi:hypothetical protein C8J56DRAFT_1170799 [Mycena floridula]|nr:hypothetical protein C8J56DRAFT_1170799 [Mycena floridula]